MHFLGTTTTAVTSNSHLLYVVRRRRFRARFSNLGIELNLASYWPSAALTLEPRLSSKWITNIGFFACIMSLPIPSASFYLPKSRLYQPTPPSLSVMMENILPLVRTKVHFYNGFLSSSSVTLHGSSLNKMSCQIPSHGCRTSEGYVRSIMYLVFGYMAIPGV